MKHDPSNRKVMGVLAYLGILIVIPFLVAKNDPFVRFHIKQGLVLLVIEIIVWILAYSYIFWQLEPIIELINLAVIVLAIIGIVNVVQGNEKELPLIGSWGRNFPV
jgi:uncharacterized membrane protein